VSAPRSGRFTPGIDPVPFVQEAGWASGLIWTCAKNLAPTGIRSPDRPARIPIELPGPLITDKVLINSLVFIRSKYLPTTLQSQFS
jgi:hypothetical protein